LLEPTESLLKIMTQHLQIIPQLGFVIKIRNYMNKVLTVYS